MRTGLIALVLAAAGSANAAVTYGFENGLAADGWTSTFMGNGLGFYDLPGRPGQGYTDSNYVNNSLNAPIANSDGIGSAGSAAFDVSFTSPAQAAAGPGTLSYEINFQSFSGLDAVDVYYGNTLLITHNTDTPVGGLFVNGAGVLFSHNINAAAGDQVRFRYYSTDTAAWEWYVQVDNVTIDVIPAPASLALVGLGGLVAGRRRR